MTKRILYILILISLISVFFSSLFASAKSEAEDEISNSKKLLKELERNKTLQLYIPYRNYHDAKVYLDTAIYQFEDEGEYDEAAFYAVLANVELETTLTIAKTRMARAQRLEFESNYFKNLSSRSYKKKIILFDANLKKDRRAHIGILPDNVLFKFKTNTLLQSGKNVLNKIYDVLRFYSWTKVKIIGYSSKNDQDNLRTTGKAEAVANYFTKVMGLKTKRFEVKGMGKVNPIEINGRMKFLDRIEIVITGIR